MMQKKSFIQVNFAKFIEHQKLSIEYMKQVKQIKVNQKILLMNLNGARQTLLSRFFLCEPSEQAETFVSDLRVDMDKIRNSSDWKRLEHTIHHDTVVQDVTFVFVKISLEVNIVRNFVTNLFPNSHRFSPV